MSLNNPVDLAPVLAQLQQTLDNLQQVSQSVASENGSTQTQLTQAEQAILQELIAQTDEIDAKLASLTTVNGELDTNAQAINQHTSDEHTATKSAVNAARDNVKTEMTRQTAGSLYSLLSSVINAARNNVKSEFVRQSAGSLYALLSGVINAARDNVKSNTNSNHTTTKNTVNAARDNIKNHVNSKIATVQAVKSVQRGRTALNAGVFQTEQLISLGSVNLSKCVLNVIQSSGVVRYVELKNSGGVKLAYYRESSEDSFLIWEVVEYA